MYIYVCMCVCVCMSHMQPKNTSLSVSWTRQWEVEVELHSFSTSTLDGSSRSATRLGRFNPSDKTGYGVKSAGPQDTFQLLETYNRCEVATCLLLICRHLPEPCGTGWSELCVPAATDMKQRQKWNVEQNWTVHCTAATATDCRF